MLRKLVCALQTFRTARLIGIERREESVEKQQSTIQGPVFAPSSSGSLNIRSHRSRVTHSRHWPMSAVKRELTTDRPTHPSIRLIHRARHRRGFIMFVRGADKTHRWHSAESPPVDRNCRVVVVYDPTLWARFQC